MEGDIPDRIENFIDARSRTYELYEVKALRRERKSKAITYFINLSRPEKAKLVEANNQIIIALPSDLNTLGIPRPQPVRYQSSSFGGKSVEYPVFSILEVIGLWNTYFSDCAK